MINVTEEAAMSREAITYCHDLIRHQSYGMVHGRTLVDSFADSFAA
jgi:hypothetical protein